MFFILLWLCSFFVPTFGSPCPPGALYGEATGKCYHFVDEPFPFLQAEEYCVKAARGHLVSINNVYEMIAVEELATKAFPYGVKTYWIGGKLIGNRPQWINGNAFKYSNWRNEVAVSSFPNGHETYWIGGKMTGNRPQRANGNAFTFSKWNEGYPGNAPPNSCIQSSRTNGHWSLASCNNAEYFVCESPANRWSPWNVASTAVTYRCDPGWQFLPSSRSCYKVIRNVNWHNGELQCKREGAHLTSIHSKEENDFVNRLTNAGKCYTCRDNPWDDQMWIGLVDSNPVPSKAAKHPYVWVDGSPMDYKNWVVGEPGFPGIEFCAMSMSNVGSCCERINFKWGDYLCTRVMRAAVCKKPAVAS